MKIYNKLVNPSQRMIIISDENFKRIILHFQRIKVTATVVEVNKSRDSAEWEFPTTDH